MIRFMTAALMMMTSVASFASPSEQTYGIHLFFNEQEFVDVLTITTDDQGGVTGFMDVPNDFAGKVDNLVIADQKITFDLFVPKNASRPEDMVFHYRGEFFDANNKQLIGFASIKGTNDFVASFTGFLRDKVKPTREN